MTNLNTLIGFSDSTVDYEAIHEKHPWIRRQKMKCILSPDSDGLLCGLFMSHYYDWEIVGYYDGKVLLLQDGVSTHDENCVFLDVEIYREHVKSIGHHMVLLNKRHTPADWNVRYRQCIQLNNLRGYDKARDFRLKYPLATIHFLLGLVGHVRKINISTSAIAPLFFADGVFNILYGYPENVLQWLRYLGIHNDSSCLRQVFMHDHFTVYEQMEVMDRFFRDRDRLNVKGERGDKFVISTSDSQFVNVIQGVDGLFAVTNNAWARLEGFLDILSGTTGWTYDASKWNSKNMRGYRFHKSNFIAEDRSMTIQNYNAFINKSPLSWAITSNDNLEFTLEYPDQLP